MRRFLLVVAVGLISCVRASRPQASEKVSNPVEPPMAAPTLDAGVDAGLDVGVDAGTPDFRAWVAPRFGAVPPAPRFAGCHDPTPGELAAEAARRRIALGRALEAKGVHLLEAQRSFMPVGPGQVVRGPNGERFLGVLMVESCAPIEPPVMAVTRDGLVVTIDASPKAVKTTTVVPCAKPRDVCPPACGARPPPMSFVVEVPPGATQRFEVLKERYAIDEAVVFPPLERYRHDCPPPP